MAKEIQINSRIIEQLARATVKTIVDGVVELVTNSDDSYRRLEEQGCKVSGDILISVSREKGGICQRLVVEDFAEGMTKEGLEEAIVFGGMSSGFALGRSVRGLFGRGLKETIIALGEGKITTIKGGRRCATTLWLDAGKPLFDDESLNNVEITSERDGTKVDIRVTNKAARIPEYQKFKAQLSTHYALRDINRSSSRRVHLRFVDKKRESKNETPITFAYPSAIKRVEKTVLIPGYGDTVIVTVYESLEALDSPRNNPYGLAGLLIKTRGAILDNQLFRFDKEPAAQYFFGEALCEGLEQRLRRGDSGIIDPNRGGLELRHEYCQSLSSAMEKILEPMVLAKKRELERAPAKEVRSSTRKLIKDLCSKLNKLAKQEVEEAVGIPEPDPQVTSLVIKPQVANVQPGSPRVFSIYAPDNLVMDKGQVVHVESDVVDILPMASIVTLVRHPKYPDQIWYGHFSVVAEREGAEGTIIANLGTDTALAKVKAGPYRETTKRQNVTGSGRGFVADIVPDELANPRQRVFYDNGIIRIYVKFPSVAKFIGSGLEGTESPEGRMLLAELVGDAFCKEMARQGIEQGKYPKIPGGEIDSFNAAVSELQRKYLHYIQDIIFEK